MRREIVVATANRHKLRELTVLLKGMGVRVIPIHALGRPPKVIENGRTFEANAVKKARIYSRFSGKLTLVDDSGLVVPSLGGRPGVISARYAGPGATYQDNNRRLLGELEGRSGPERRAYFQCTVALSLRGKSIKLLTGRCRGAIATSGRGRNGFGYDPVFIPAGFRKTYAEMSPRLKNRISHRARALKVTRRFLGRFFSSQ